MGGQDEFEFHKDNNNDLLGTVDDEVSSGVERALVQLGQVTVVHVGEHAVGGPARHRVIWGFKE